MCVTMIVRGQVGHNPVYKLGDIYPVVTGNFMNVWKPGKNICIDEGMIPFRGRVHFKVYNPDKPDKYGVKSYQLCDSENGFCRRFELYIGVSCYQCKVCKVTLCVQNCFELYQTVEDYVSAYIRKHDRDNSSGDDQ